MTPLLVNVLLLLAASVGLATTTIPNGPEGSTRMMITQAAAAERHPYVGMWVTADGNVRHNLLPNDRYDEARGNRESAYRGRYKVTGSYIEYWDDTGFTADGTFVDADTLHHGGMILRRRP
ncbi:MULTISPECIES: Atu4866 domain-containing protein [unclassified Bosea (in: a-proteobacteria)]|uniref:Atu4866 domain-containing protein n=1 Tax=unclassified Bosea (in: a-proteobacteria) TaxID=2653178 RepID=UPI0019D2E6E1|nr:MULTISPECIES: Atu4866 domain-containing protein [unclassified Bosea (in: a-proteobacteria)]